MQVQFVTSADGTEIAYGRTGDGPPLVLVHGSASDRTVWREVRPGLADGFTVYAVDRRGRGDSGDAEPYEIEREYADVAALAERVAAGHDAPVSLLGHSYGAIVALHAVLETDAVDRLVLYEPPLADAPAEAGMADALEAELASDGPEAALVTFLREAVELTDGEIELMRADDRWPNHVAAAPTLPREIRATQRGLFDPGRFGGVDLPVTLIRELVGPADYLEFDPAGFEVYRDRGGEWRWRLVHRNGNILADSGESYTRRNDANRAVDRIREGIDDLAFEVYEDNAGEHRWRLLGGNDRILADSGEGYDSRSGAEDAVERVSEYAPEADVLDIGQAAFETYEDAGGEYRWRLRHRNGNILADSGEGFGSRSGALDSIDRIKRNAPAAGTEEAE